MWTFIPSSTSASAKLQPLMASVTPLTGDVKIEQGVGENSKDEKSISVDQQLVKRNGALTAVSAGRKKSTQRRKLAMARDGRIVRPGKNGKKTVFAFTEEDKPFNSTGFPGPYHVGDNNQPYYIMQNYEVTNFHLSSASVATFDSAMFQITNLDQVASLTNVFDQYKIALVELWLTPKASTVVSTTGLNTGLLHSVIDYDDANNLTTIGQANDYDNVMVTSGVVGHYRRFIPHVQNQLIGAFLQNMTAPWVDSASTTVPHYGFKIAITTTDVVYAYDLIVRLHTLWRNVR